MPRIARVVLPGVPHHITQRGNRRQKTFFGKTDFKKYRSLLIEWSQYYSVDILAYCLMNNHVHYIAVPNNEYCLRKAIAETHRRYTRYINFRKRWRGHLWQGRFASFPMDDSYLLMAARYIERNPVNAGIVQRPEDYPWSSARAHLDNVNDPLLTGENITERVDDWNTFLKTPLTKTEFERFYQHERNGRPLGNKAFIEKAEQTTNRTFSYRSPGKPRDSIT